MHLAALALAFCALFAPDRASAGEPLFARACVLASERALSFVEARAAAGWNCRPADADVRAPYVWLRAAGDLPQGERQRLEGDAMPVAGLTTVLLLGDGSVRERRHDAAAIARHPTSGSRFSLRLYTATEAPRALFVRVDRPFDLQVVRSLRLEAGPASRARELEQMILFGVLIGMLLMVALYSLSLYASLRTPFALAHAAMVLFFLQYTFASSSLLFLVFPDASLWQRTSLAYTGLALSMAMLAPFLTGFVEREVIPPGLRRAIYASAGLLVVAAIAVPVLGPHLPFVTRTAYHLAFVPGLLTFVAFGAVAWTRGSRAVRLVAFAWSVPALFASERILRATGAYHLPDWFDLAFFQSMGFQAIAMAFAIAWRIGEIRKERDRALEQGDELARMAGTDALTGLPNRRAFDMRHWRSGDYLAIVDIDHFKRINDRLGHATGDEVLRAIGAALRAEVGRNGVIDVWRMGGEEFTVLLMAGSPGAAALEVNRIRDRIGAAIVSQVAAVEDRVTASAGLARIAGGRIEDAYEHADRALYHAKASGRDRLSWDAGGCETATIFPRRSRRAA